MIPSLEFRVYNVNGVVMQGNDKAKSGANLMSIVIDKVPDRLNWKRFHWWGFRGYMRNVPAIRLALIVSWISYLHSDNPPVIDFGDLSIGTVILLTVGVACTAALLTIDFTAISGKSELNSGGT